MKLQILGSDNNLKKTVESLDWEIQYCMNHNNGLTKSWLEVGTDHGVLVQYCSAIKSAWLDLVHYHHQILLKLYIFSVKHVKNTHLFLLVLHVWSWAVNKSVFTFLLGTTTAERKRLWAEKRQWRSLSKW